MCLGVGYARYKPRTAALKDRICTPSVHVYMDKQNICMVWIILILVTNLNSSILSLIMLHSIAEY